MCIVLVVVFQLSTLLHCFKMDYLKIDDTRKYSQTNLQYRYVHCVVDIEYTERKRGILSFLKPTYRQNLQVFPKLLRIQVNMDLLGDPDICI